ncbi:MAG: hypothetical protein IT347_11760 [Candidatus Eisenbacteria bacterium]|nr:hypothetical protein [Candidatus Eisenbacteria bacterium]
MKEMRLVLNAVAWTFVTFVIGLRACVRGIQLAVRSPQVFRTETRCPRGHRVALHGTYACGRCGAQFEGGAFDPCPGCGALAHHVSCPRCGLSLLDPLR